MIIGLAYAHRGDGHGPFFGWNQYFGNRHPISLCANSTVAQAYLTQVLSLITNLQLNSTYNPVLQLQSPNFVSYLQNTTNQALLSTNCTAFVTNLKMAKLADELAERIRENIAFNIQYQLKQVARSATGGRSNELCKE